ncbi:type II toxin-antitoxin system RelE/ParE family toxin [Pseudidiomarina aestuarii]|uniref:type II toxin-antitoxin system RelE/ParE family toxin n=1 Tax=Pseudidiomarina aestuarii TaxID=624146 RepID=UPI003A97AFE8
MTWKVIVSDTYARWFLALSESEQVDVQAMVEVLEVVGPHLKRPYTDTIKGTRRFKNLKELIIQTSGNPYRVFYAFDPKRQAVLLCGGRKDGSRGKLFYKEMVRIAEEELAAYLKSAGY